MTWYRLTKPGQEFKDSYAYFYEKDYGPWRPVVEKNVQRFLECGCFQHGFARVRCDGCDREYLLAFSCKTRSFCPSCQAKRVAAFVEWVTVEVLEEVDHRQLLWTIPVAFAPRHLQGFCLGYICGHAPPPLPPAYHSM